MVLSPIEPVAPRTVTARTADAAALLLRNGTALMLSPNHKTPADAIRATPQKPENRRQEHRSAESVETIHQSAMPGNDMAGVLDSETPFHRGFKEIAKLGSDRENRAEQQQRAQPKGRIHFAKCGKSRGDHKARHKPTNGSGPRLLGTDPRPEFRSANAAACEVTADIGYPYPQKDEDKRDQYSSFIS